ncbi:hypothetical protein BX600DRAFT_85948 [Xylariales sp. PMI_506]|nr:hypothetical protein BX600DRAFT_85948 [Xylariales sp. PMI_506]
MGNNKGRSKGCVTCLQRRVKCDEALPICLRCTRGGFVCRGYRETLFIDGKDQVLRRLDRKITSQFEQRNPSFSSLSIPPTPSVSPICNHQYLSYLVKNLNGPMADICCALVTQNYQVISFPQIVLKQCFVALAMTFFGFSHAHESLVKEGRRHYLAALKMVNATISKPRSPNTKELLSSIYALCLHEAIAPTSMSEHSWLRHIDGLEQFFSTHQPIEGERSITSALLEITRPVMIVAALHARRPSLMARREWTAAAIYRQSKNNKFSPESAIADLLDALAELPSLYHEGDALETRKRPYPGINNHYMVVTVRALINRSLDLRDRVLLMKSQLQVIRQVIDFPSILYTPVAPVQPYPCTHIRNFSTIHWANAFMLYNTLVVLINQFLSSLYLLLPVCEVEVLSGESVSKQTFAAITEIIESIPYQISFLRSTSTFTTGNRNFYLLFPIRIARQALLLSHSAQDTTKRLWLDDIFDMIRRQGGPWMSNDQIFGVQES